MIVESSRAARFSSRPVWPWFAAAGLAALAGLGASRLTGTYIAVFVAGVILVAIYFWRSADPFVPFLVLVAAIQGGVLLKLQAEAGPIQTILPFLGGWVLLALLVKSSRWDRAQPDRAEGSSLLPLAALALLALIVATACLQYLRPSGTVLDRTGLLTLVQLGILVAISAYLLREPRRVILVGYVTVGSGVIGSLLALADRLNLVSLGTEISSGSYERISGAIDDPNKAAYQLLVPLAFAINLALAARSTRAKIGFWAAAAILSAGIASTYSAGALVGLAAVAVTTVVLQTRLSLKRGLAAVSFIAVLTIVVAATLPPGYTQAVGAKYSGLSSAPTANIATGRGAAWEAGIRTVVRNPLLGSGLSTATVQKAVARNYTEATISNKAAHNMYIAMAVGTGVLGLVAFLAFLGSSLSALWSAHARALRGDQRDITVAASCLLTALVVTATQGLQLDLQMEKYLWVLLGAALASRYWSTERRQNPPISSQHG